ncbi:transposase [Streptomyces sp. NBC_00233]|nr:transposase [Streptomyces sp. NBC_00233]
MPQVRRTYAPRGRTPLLRHRLNWKRASMAAALGHHAAAPERLPRLCFHLKPGSHDTAALIEVLEQMKPFYRGERVVLVWDGLSAHWVRPVWVRKDQGSCGLSSSAADPGNSDASCSPLSTPPTGTGDRHRSRWRSSSRS